MATWTYVKDFIQANFKARDVEEDRLRLDFGFDDGRSQMVLVSHIVSNGGAEWVEVESPVAKVAEVDLGAALEFVSSQVCGSLSRAGEFLTVRHTLPLANVDQNEIIDPIRSIALAGDVLEQRLTGVDRF
jgi:hypothetical protein